MKNNIWALILKLLALLAVVVPIIPHIRNTQWSASYLPGELFPLFGLLAFSLLWLHIVGPVLEPWLSRQVNFDKFLKSTSPYIFAFMLLHPILLLLDTHFSIGQILSSYEADDVVLGAVGLLLLLSYDLGKFMKKNDFIVRNWKRILLLSSVGFIIIFFHSLSLGDDLQSGFLRYLWIFYGVTGIAAILYNYFVRRFIHKDTSPLSYESSENH